MVGTYVMMRRLILGFLAAAIAGGQTSAPVPDAGPCRELAQRGAADGAIAYQAGLCFEPTRDLASAVNAYRQALALGFQPATATAHRAGIYLVTGQKERALFEIQVPNEQNCGDTEIQQLKFWVGEWDTQRRGGRKALKTIEAVLGSCALLEKWSSGADEEGIHLLFHDPTAEKWYHYGADFASPTGQRYFESTGELRNGELHFAGTRPFLHRRTITPQSPRQIREVLEASTDAGVTWKTEANYVRVR